MPAHRFDGSIAGTPPESVVLKTFVDPQRFRATCYQAAGWEQVEPTQRCGRDWQDFDTDTRHPKQLWVRAPDQAAFEQAWAPELPPP